MLAQGMWAQSMLLEITEEDVDMLAKEVAEEGMEAAAALDGGAGSQAMQAPMQAPHTVVLSKTRMCEHHLGLRSPNRCWKGPNCGFAHTLGELNVPNETKEHGRWSKVWDDGEVDIVFWPNVFRSPKSKSRFRSAFLWELQRTRTSKIPNWAWGVGD